MKRLVLERAYELALGLQCVPGRLANHPASWLLDSPCRERKGSDEVFPRVPSIIHSLQAFLLSSSIRHDAKHWGQKPQ